jgi:bifunctional non-homologous end joining protein LigD
MVERARFVIQQHDATRLHWDLRLERDGVLRSWALPRGIPWSPKENRLAVATEDHPLEFLDYEGDDAEPGYGTGRMSTWDTGTYETHKWEDGKVVVTLDGRRVSGRYSLFSMRGSGDWLIHRMDPPDDDRRVRVPIGVVPMTAAGGQFPEDDGWAYEPRWHGIRALVTAETGRVVITDGVGGNLSLEFPEVRRIGRALGHRELILDGVIVPIDGPTGKVRHDRSGLARRLRIASDSGARNAARTSPVVFMAFDVAWTDGRPIFSLPWELRRRQLDDLRLDGPGWRTSPLLGVDEAVELLGAGYGVVAKRIDSRYEIGTSSSSWIRVT